MLTSPVYASKFSWIIWRQPSVVCSSKFYLNKLSIMALTQFTDTCAELALIFHIILLLFHIERPLSLHTISDLDTQWCSIFVAYRERGPVFRWRFTWGIWWWIWEEFYTWHYYSITAVLTRYSLMPNSCASFTLWQSSWR